MKKEKNIVESVNFLSEEDLLVQELDRRLSFDVVLSGAVKETNLCDCILKKIDVPTNSTCGVRG